MKFVPDKLVDDLVRHCVINALSGNVMPPEIIDGKVVERTGYTAQQHEAIVDSAKKLMQRHGLSDWKSTTTDA